MSDQPPTPPSSAGANFCGECGAAMPADARFCGSCGAAPTGGADPTEAMPAAGAGAGASTWQGVEPVVERPTEVVPPVGPGGPPTAPAGPPSGPPAGGPPAGGPPGGPPPAAATGKSKGPLVVVVLLVLAALIGGAVVLLGGDDDEGGDDVEAGFDRDEDEGDDEETTTTTEAEETTTTTEAEETTTTAGDDPSGDINFVRVLDDSSLLAVEVPDTWQVDGRPLQDGSPNIIASPDIANIGSNVASSLSYTRLTGTPDPDTTIDQRIALFGLDTSCADVGERNDYSDGVFTGRSQVFTGCNAGQATIIEIVGARSDGATVEVTIALVEPDPIEIAEHIQLTFNLTA